MSPEEFVPMNSPKKEVSFLSSDRRTKLNYQKIRRTNKVELLEDLETKVELLENKENNSLDFPQIKVTVDSNRSVTVYENARTSHWYF